MEKLLNNKVDVNLLDYYIKMDGQKVLLYYKGPFDDQILAKISKYLRKKLIEFPKAGKRLFSIFVELAQNIAYYSSETNLFDEEDCEKGCKTGIGSLAIYDTNDAYILSCGNLVETNDTENIMERCQKINDLDYTQLRTLKREYLKAPRLNGHKGANIGLIQVALKSENPLKLDIKKVNEDYSYIILTSNIAKKCYNIKRLI